MLINTWPTMLSRQWEAFNEKKLLLYLAVESALHTPKSETSCCVAYFCLALAKQITSFIGRVKLFLFQGYFWFVPHPFLPSFSRKSTLTSNEFPINSNGKILKKIYTWRLPLYEYLILKSGLIWSESIWELCRRGKIKIPVKSQVFCHFEW